MSVTPDLELAVIGNCQVAALLDGQARLVWACLPRPDGDPVFSALLTPGGGDAANGVFAVDLQDLAHATQAYARNTAIVETTLHDTRGGSIRITDYSPRYRARGRMFRPMMLVRIVEPLAGRPIVRMRLRPTVRYGAAVDPGHSAGYHLSFTGGPVAWRVTTDGSLSAIQDERPVVLEQPITFLLGADETIHETPSVLARSMLDETRSYWQDWVRTLAVPFDWQQAVIRAAITLKLCTYEDSGALLAALTTSIPESPDSGRNWDYRYCWLRDSSFVVQALNRLGATRTMEAYLHFIDHIVGRATTGELQPLYGIAGDSNADEQVVPTLAGFRGMGPVRVGNQAALQKQHDVYGAVILSAAQLFFDERLVRGGDQHLFERLEALGERAAAVYELPDSGPWEFRGLQRPHTFSATMSWAGCDRLARIAHRLGLGEAERRWRSRSAAMRERILCRAWNARRGAFVGAFDGDELDATVLLLPELGLLPADDPRFLATLEVVARELVDGDLVYRYRHADDFGPPQTTFVICASWYINALAAVGRLGEARERFEGLLARRTRLGLLAEDIDPASGALWGNFPQTYSMVGVINNALRLSRPWEQAV